MKGSIKNKILFVLSLLLGLMFINGGLNKFFNYIPAPDNMPEKMQKTFAAFMEIRWLMPLIAIIEILGGILVIIPKTRALGALIVLPVMIGILLTHIVQDPGNLPVALVLSAILAWIIFDNKEKYLQLIK